MKTRICLIYFFDDCRATKCAITDTTLYVPVATLSNKDNVKLTKQLESGFKRTINWNKCQAQNGILN